MKKTVFYLLVVLTFFSCKGEDGKDGIGANIVTKKITINKNQWTLAGKPSDLGSYYYVTVKVPELTPFVMDHGVKLAYIEPESRVQVGMPYVLHKGAVINNKEYLWTQTYDCEYEEGYVTFILTYSDFITSSAPDTEVFHLLLSW